MTRRFHFHGDLGQRFAPHYDLASPTVRRAVRLLAVQIPGFAAAVAARHFEVIRGTIGEAGAVALDDTLLDMKLGACRDVHLIPVIEGEGGRSGKTAAKIVLGVALIGTGVAGAAGAFGATAAGGFNFAGAVPGLAGVITYGNLVQIGAGLALPGAASALPVHDEGSQR